MRAHRGAPPPCRLPESSVPAGQRPAAPASWRRGGGSTHAPPPPATPLTLPHPPRRVPLVPHREERWRQEGWLALPAVGVAREDPPLEGPPDRLVHRVGIVAQDDGGSRRIELRQGRPRVESRA